MWIKPKDVLPCNQSIVGRAAIGKTCHLNDYLPGCIRLKRFVIANLCFNQTTFYARFLHFYKAVVEVVFSPPLKTGFIREKSCQTGLTGICFLRSQKRLFFDDCCCCCPRRATPLFELSRIANFFVFLIFSLSLFRSFWLPSTTTTTFLLFSARSLGPKNPSFCFFKFEIFLDASNAGIGTGSARPRDAGREGG